MSRYTGPKCKLSRALNFDLGNKSGGVAIEKKCKFGVTPGGSAQKRGRTSDYGLQLKMKQTIRHFYELREKQFKRYYTIASQMQGSTGQNLLTLLERRLDNVVYRLGYAATRSDARQLVSHGHIEVNGKRLNIPSYFVQLNDVVSVKESSRQSERVTFAMKLSEMREPVLWLETDRKEFNGVVKSFPGIDDFPAYFKVNLVVEFYSK